MPKIHSTTCEYCGSELDTYGMCTECDLGVPNGCEECGKAYIRLVVIFRTLVCETCARRHLREMQEQLEVQR